MAQKTIKQIKPNNAVIEKGAAFMLDGLLSFDWKKDENFKETPKRVAKAMVELCAGIYDAGPAIKTFPTHYKGMVIVKHIKSIGLCPHHLMPIEYDISFAYIPNGRALGLSKIPRIIKHVSASPVLQEDLTELITGAFENLLIPLGTAVVVTGKHGCMKFRGVKEQDSVVTSRVTGSFENLTTREEFYKILEKI